MQNFSSEKKLLQQNLQLNPDSIMAYNTLALVLKADGDLDAARLNIEKAIAVKPNAQSFYNLAKIDLELGKMDEAKLNFEKAIELNPYFSDSYNNLATVYIGMRQFQEAIVQLGQALKIEAKNALALYNLGYCYEQLNLRAKALTYYKLALALQPTNLTMQQAVFELEK